MSFCSIADRNQSDPAVGGVLHALSEPSFPFRLHKADGQKGNVSESASRVGFNRGVLATSECARDLAEGSPSCPVNQLKSLPTRGLSATAHTHAR